MSSSVRLTIAYRYGFFPILSKFFECFIDCKHKNDIYDRNGFWPFYQFYSFCDRQIILSYYWIYFAKPLFVPIVQIIRHRCRLKIFKFKIFIFFFCYLRWTRAQSVCWFGDDFCWRRGYGNWSNFYHAHQLSWVWIIDIWLQTRTWFQWFDATV